MKIRVLPILIFSSLFLQSCGGGVTKLKSTSGDTYTFKKENVSCRKDFKYTPSSSGDIRCRANGTITDLANRIYSYSSKWERCLNTHDFDSPESFNSFACSAAKDLGVYQKIKPRKIKFTFNQVRWNSYKKKNPDANIEDFNFSEESLLEAQKIKRYREEIEKKRKRELAEREEKRKRDCEENRRNIIRRSGTTGIGVLLRLDEKTGFPIVEYVDKRMPAYKGGLKLNDLITAIEWYDHGNGDYYNYQSTKGKSLCEIKDLMPNDYNSIVKLTIQREDPGRGLPENLTISFPIIRFMVDKNSKSFDWF